VNTHSRSPQWLLAFTGEQGSRALGRLHKDDLVRELTTTGKKFAKFYPLRVFPEGLYFVN